MSTINALPAGKLYQACDLSLFTFQTTAELEATTDKTNLDIALERLLLDFAAARDAISRNAHRYDPTLLEALIDFVPHKGALVTEISASDAADIYAIRLALEPATFERSIPHLTEADFARAEMREIRLRYGGGNGFQAHFCLHGNAGCSGHRTPMATMAHRHVRRSRYA